MKKKITNCGTCLYWLPGDASIEGLCRRYPPAALVMGWQRNPIVMSPEQGTGHAIVNAAFPPMHRTGWCGEFKRKKP